MNKLLKIVIEGILVAVLVSALVYGLWSGLQKNEVVECKTWLAQSVEYKDNFYLLNWQDEQCKAHNIVINATVR